MFNTELGATAATAAKTTDPDPGWVVALRLDNCVTQHAVVGGDGNTSKTGGTLGGVGSSKAVVGLVL